MSSRRDGIRDRVQREKERFYEELKNELGWDNDDLEGIDGEPGEDEFPPAEKPKAWRKGAEKIQQQQNFQVGEVLDDELMQILEGLDEAKAMLDSQGSDASSTTNLLKLRQLDEDFLDDGLDLDKSPAELLAAYGITDDPYSVGSVRPKPGSPVAAVLEVLRATEATPPTAPTDKPKKRTATPLEHSKETTGTPSLEQPKTSQATMASTHTTTASTHTTTAPIEKPRKRTPISMEQPKTGTSTPSTGSNGTDAQDSSSDPDHTTTPGEPKRGTHEPDEPKSTTQSKSSKSTPASNGNRARTPPRLDLLASPMESVPSLQLEGNTPVSGRSKNSGGSQGTPGNNPERLQNFHFPAGDPNDPLDDGNKMDSIISRPSSILKTSIPGVSGEPRKSATEKIVKIQENMAAENADPELMADLRKLRAEMAMEKAKLQDEREKMERTNSKLQQKVLVAQTKNELLTAPGAGGREHRSSSITSINSDGSAASGISHISDVPIPDSALGVVTQAADDDDPLGQSLVVKSDVPDMPTIARTRVKSKEKIEKATKAEHLLGREGTPKRLNLVDPGLSGGVTADRPTSGAARMAFKKAAFKFGLANNIANSMSPNEQRITDEETAGPSNNKLRDLTESLDTFVLLNQKKSNAKADIPAILRPSFFTCVRATYFSRFASAIFGVFWGIILFSMFSYMYLVVTWRAMESVNVVRSRASKVEVVTVDFDKHIFIDGKPFVVRGINYSPVTSGQVAWSWPYGDYMTQDYVERYQHHLQIISKLFNTIRIYNWQLDQDHTPFLDMCEQYGIKVIVTFWMDSLLYPDLDEEPEDAMINFRHLVRAYKGHPAILMWAIANEPNLPGVDESFATNLPSFFRFVNILANIRDEEEGEAPFYPHPITIPLADTDFTSIIDNYDYVRVDVWSIQPYRGVSFTDLFDRYTSAKPLLVSEYGMDSLVDLALWTDQASSAFEWSDEKEQQGPYIDEQYMSDSVYNLTYLLTAEVSSKYFGAPGLIWQSEVYNNETHTPTATRTLTPTATNSPLYAEAIVERAPLGKRCVGGIIFEFIDEWWKGVRYDTFHRGCEADNETIQSSCGAFAKGYGKDQRKNEEFFGLWKQVELEDDGPSKKEPGPNQKLQICLRAKRVVRDLYNFWTRTQQLAEFANYSSELCISGECCVQVKSSTASTFFSFLDTDEAAFYVVVLVLFVLAVLGYIIGFLQRARNQKKLDQRLERKSALFEDVNSDSDDEGKPNDGANQRHKPNTMAHLVGVSRIKILHRHVRFQTKLSEVEDPIRFTSTDAEYKRQKSFRRGSGMHPGSGPFRKGSKMGLNPIMSLRLMNRRGSSVKPSGLQSILGSMRTTSTFARAQSIRRLEMQSESMQAEYPLEVWETVVDNISTAFSYYFEDAPPRAVERYLNDNQAMSAGYQANKDPSKNLPYEFVSSKAPGKPFSTAVQRRVYHKYIWGELLRVAAELDANGFQSPLVYDYAHSSHPSMTNFNLLSIFKAVRRVCKKVLPECLYLKFVLYDFPEFKERVPEHEDMFTEFASAEENLKTFRDQHLIFTSPLGKIASTAKVVDNQGTFVSKEDTNPLDQAPMVESPQASPKHEQAEASRRPSMSVNMPKQKKKVMANEKQQKMIHRTIQMTKLTLFYLIMHHKMENLRQCPAMLITLIDEVLVSSEAKGEASFSKQVQKACKLIQDHLRKVNSAHPEFQDVNYADIDELYSTIIGTRFPNQAGYPQYTTLGIFPITFPLSKSLWIQSRRRVPILTIHDDEEKDEFVIKPGLIKTFPEGINWAVPLRLFLFNFHAHLLVFAICLLLSMYVSVGVVVWYVTVLESIVPLFVVGLDLWINHFNYTISVLRWAEIAAACYTLQYLIGTPFGAGPDLLKEAEDFSLEDAEGETFFGMPVGMDIFGMTLSGKLLVCFGYLAIRTMITFIRSSTIAVRSARKTTAQGKWFGHHIRSIFGNVNWKRIIFFFFMGASSLFLMFVSSTQVIGLLAINLCRCADDYHLYPIACDPVGVYCYMGVFGLLLCTYISTLLITHVIFILESIFFSFFTGIKESIGSVKEWEELRVRMKQMLGMENEELNFEQYGAFASIFDKRWALKQIFRRLEERHLISKQNCDSMLREQFNQKPKSEEACVQLFNWVNGHLGLVDAMSSYHELLHVNNMNSIKSVNRGPATYNMSPSIFTCPSITMFVPFYTETVICSDEYLIKQRVLFQLVDLFPDEWENLCDKEFYGAPNDEVLAEYIKQGHHGAELWLKYKRKFRKAMSLPGKARRTAALPWQYKWKYDPPPDHGKMLVEGQEMTTQEKIRTLNQLSAWVNMRVRLWASNRCQTLARTVHGQCEMREAMADLATNEIHAISRSEDTCMIMEDYHPTTNSDSEDVYNYLESKGFGKFHTEAWEVNFQNAGMTWRRFKAIAEMGEVGNQVLDNFGRRTTMLQLKQLPPPEDVQLSACNTPQGFIQYIHKSVSAPVDTFNGDSGLTLPEGEMSVKDAFNLLKALTGRYWEMRREPSVAVALKLGPAEIESLNDVTSRRLKDSLQNLHDLQTQKDLLRDRLPPRFNSITMAHVLQVVGVDGPMLLSIHDAKDVEWVIAKYWDIKLPELLIEIQTGVASFLAKRNLKHGMKWRDAQVRDLRLHLSEEINTFLHLFEEFAGTGIVIVLLSALGKDAKTDLGVWATSKKVKHLEAILGLVLCVRCGSKNEIKLANHISEHNEARRRAVISKWHRAFFQFLVRTYHKEKSDSGETIRLVNLVKNLEFLLACERKAQWIVAQKYQVLIAAQAYHQHEPTRKSVDELRRLQKYIHMEIVTAKNDLNVNQYESVHFRSLMPDTELPGAVAPAQIPINKSWTLQTTSFGEETQNILFESMQSEQEQGRCSRFGCKRHAWEGNIVRRIVDVVSTTNRPTRVVKDFWLNEGASRIALPADFNKAISMHCQYPDYIVEELRKASSAAGLLHPLETKLHGAVEDVFEETYKGPNLASASAGSSWVACNVEEGGHIDDEECVHEHDPNEVEADAEDFKVISTMEKGRRLLFLQRKTPVTSQTMYKLIYVPCVVQVRSCILHQECFVCASCLEEIGPDDLYELEEQTKQGAYMTYLPYHFSCIHRRRMMKGEARVARTSNLIIGEPKAENQNNMLPMTWGEIINIMDMNQDAYYGEGFKLPIIFSFFNRDGFVYEILGFREHIFTNSHSAIGRYMAIAEFSFVTLIQRFLAKLHNVRLHYGHPDMVNAMLVKQTGGVSRGSKRVNVNEDVFLGYEMLLADKGITFLEYLTYGKGREVDFEGSSVFLKKLAAGAAMQLRSRQVYALYTTEIPLTTRWALYYGSLAHYINAYLMDLTVFLLAHVFVIFIQAGVTPHRLYLNASSFAAPWIIQIGFLHIVPMLAEMNLEHSYLRFTDVVMSLPFFSHQNRITASFFSTAVTTGSASYMGTKRGIGHDHISLQQILAHHFNTNMIPGLKLLVLIIYFIGRGGSAMQVWILILSALSCLCSPILYNPFPTFAGWMEEVGAFLAFLDYPAVDVPEQIDKFQAQVKEDGPNPRSLAHFWINDWLNLLITLYDSQPSHYVYLMNSMVGNTVKYAFWAFMMIFAIVPKAEDPATNALTHGFMIDVYLIVCCTMVSYMVDLMAAKHRSSAEKATRTVKLAIIPTAYIIMIIAFFINDGEKFTEKLLSLVVYYFFTGIIFACLHDFIISIGTVYCRVTRKKNQFPQGIYRFLRWIAIHYPILAIYQATMIAAFGFFSITHLIAAMVSGIHTTFLFNERVSKRYALDRA